MKRTIKNLLHWCTAWIYHAKYGFPARKLKIIGITGTDGKTTTSSLVYHILKAAGKKVSVITTVSAMIGGVSYDTGFHVTTPDPHKIPEYMAKAVQNGDEYMVFEITSHALDQHRAAPVRFCVGGITNITHEHLDYHKTMEAYIKAKSKLLRLSNVSFINGDQPDIADKLISYAFPHAQKQEKGEISETTPEITPEATKAQNQVVYTYGFNQGVDLTYDISARCDIYLERYNRYNFMLAYLICRELGVTDEVFRDAVHTYQFPPGRMEVVYDKDFTVILDFAHTPNALSEALAAIAEKYPGRSIIHIFGSAGKRDITKRPEMGDASGAHATKVILTEEDHRDEDPRQIADMIAIGLQKHGFSTTTPENMHVQGKAKEYAFVIPRDVAVTYVLTKLVQSGDIVVATGKAHESTLCRGEVEYPYNEKDTILKAIASRS